MFSNIILFNKLISHCAHAFYSFSFCAILWWCCDLMFLNLFPFIPSFAVHHFLCITRSWFWKFHLLRKLSIKFENTCLMWEYEGEVRRKFHIMVMWKFSLYWKILIHSHFHFFLLIISLFACIRWYIFLLTFLCSKFSYVTAPFVQDSYIYASLESDLEMKLQLLMYQEGYWVLHNTLAHEIIQQLNLFCHCIEFLNCSFSII